VYDSDDDEDEEEDAGEGDDENGRGRSKSGLMRMANAMGNAHSFIRKPSKEQGSNPKREGSSNKKLDL
jgi:hypothetical protein